MPHPNVHSLLLICAIKTQSTCTRPATRDVALYLLLPAIKYILHMSEQYEKISGLIIDYLGKHPDAQDTLEGIAGWWLSFEMIDLSTEAVADALESLVRQGIITMRVSGDGTTLYRLTKCK